MILAVIMAAAFVLIPAVGVDGAYHSIEGEKNVIAVEEEAEFTIIYTDSEHDAINIEFTAKVVDSKGNTISDAVDPSSESIDSGTPVTLTVTAPKDAGSYTLEVTYTGHYTVDDVDTDIEEVTDKYAFKAVNPITLTANIALEDSNVDLSGYGVYFWVDGEKMDDSYTTFSVDSTGTGSASYDWVADAASGKHTFKLESANGGVVDIEGLNEEHDFYVGDNDYSVYIALVIIFVILAIILLVWVYRKPVKNFGKPKSRR